MRLDEVSMSVDVDLTGVERLNIYPPCVKGTEFCLATATGAKLIA